MYPRLQAIHTIGQFATDFGPRQTVATGKGKAKKLKKVPNFQDQYGAHVWHVLCVLLLHRQPYCSTNVTLCFALIFRCWATFAPQWGQQMQPARGFVDWQP